MKTRICVWGLVMFGWWVGTIEAATYYWDGTTAAAYQPTSGVWETDAFWTLNGTALTTWPGGTTHDVIFNCGTPNIVTINSGVTVNSLSLATGNGCAVTITNGTLTVGVGGISSAGNQTAGEVIYSAVVLGADQTWTMSQNLWLNGKVNDGGNGYGITKNGINTLYLYGDNAFSGNFIAGQGPTVAYTTAGLPLGAGSLILSNGVQVSLTPSGSGSDVALLGGTNGNKSISFSGLSKVYVNKGSQTGATFTFGKADDVGSPFIRSGRSILVISDTTGSGPSMGVNGRFKLANGTTGVSVHNNMVDPYIASCGLGSSYLFGFLNYDPTSGFVAPTYNSFANGKTGDVQDNTKLYQSANNIRPMLTNNCTVYAYAQFGNSSMTLSNNAVLNIGNGVQPAGLILANGISNDVDSTSSRIDFGASEGIILHGTGTKAITVPLAGSGGITFASVGGGTLISDANNTYTGDTTVQAGTLQIGSGAARGALASTNLVVNGTISFNNSGSLDWSGTMSGGGTVQNVGSGVLNLTLIGSGNAMGTIQNNGPGTMSLTAAGNNAINYIYNLSSGTLNLYGDKSVTNATWFMRAVSGSIFNILGGTWSTPTAGSNSVDTQWRGEVTITNATVVFSGGYLRGHNTINNGGAIVFIADRCGFGQAGATIDNPSITVNDGGLFDVWGTSYNFYYNGLSGETLTFTMNGGEARFGVLPGSGSSKDLDLANGGTVVTTNILTINGGKLTVAGSIKCTQTAAYTTINFHGGTLAASAINLANVDSTTLTNAGGVLAPGTIGLSGKTTLTGGYVETSPNAALALDVGGTSQGSAWTNASNYYDYLSISGSGTFVGKLSATLVNGYVPAAKTTTFTVISAATLAAGFANVVNGKVWATDGYSRFDVVTNATTLVLSNYTANGWANTAGGDWTTDGNWSVAAPNGNGMGGYFGTNLAATGTVNVDAAQTVRALYFTNSTASYTLAGSALTLQGDGVVNPAITVAAGSHTIVTAVALSNAVTMAVNNAADSLTISGAITGSNAVTKVGNGTLVLGGNNVLGSLTVNGGSVSNYAGTASVGPLTLAAGTTFTLSGGTLTTTGLTLPATSKFDFTSRSTGVLRILKGTDGAGAIDTTNEVASAITSGLITKGGATVTTYSFLVDENGGTPAYVTVQLRPTSTGAIIRVY